MNEQIRNQHFPSKVSRFEVNYYIFDSVESISVTLNNLYLDKLVAICLIEIIINNKEILKVIDIIKFNDENKIIEVSAYKQ